MEIIGTCIPAPKLLRIVFLVVEFRRDALLAEQSKKVVNGIREQCFLNGILEIPDDVPIDAMHQFFWFVPSPLYVAS